MNSFAYEHNGRSCTRQQFYAVACDPQRSVVVEACAGAGKTWMLVSRILRALLDEAEPQDILAITFTKKAAGEMRQRLQEWLDDFAAPRPATDEKAAETEAAWQQRLLAELQNRGLGAQGALQRRERLQVMRQALLVHGRPVQIRTFHSWFIALLAGAPLSLLRELDLPGQYELIEDEADAVAEAWRPFLRRVQADEGLRADYVQLLPATADTACTRPCRPRCAGAPSLA